MANVVYPKALQRCLSTGLALDTVGARAVLSDSADYTYSAVHEFLSDVPAGARVSVSANLTTPTIGNGVFDSDDFVFPLATGDQSEQLIVYHHTIGGASADTQRPLILYYDTGIGGMPITPNGQNITVTLGANWFAL